MRNELCYIPNNSAALRWSIGCCVAALVERSRTLFLLDVAAIRWAGSLVLGFRAIDAFLATLLTLAYRTDAVGVLDRLDHLIPGDSYERLIPLMETVPLWLHSVWLMTAGAYALAITAMLRRSAAAYGLVAVAVGTEVLAGRLGNPIIAAVGVAANENPSLLATLLLPIALPLLVALAASSGSRRNPA